MTTLPRKIHLDTDLAGDPDDLCALAMLLGRPDVEIVAITTSDDPGGRRAGYVAHCLDIVGCGDIPLACGAGWSSTTLRPSGSIPDDERYWPQPVPPRPSRPGAVLDVLDQSVEQGATIVTIGPFTNLALLELNRPGPSCGSFHRGHGWLPDVAGTRPAQWGPERDWNVQCDTRAAEILFEAASDLTLVTVAQTVRAHLRASDVPRLRAANAVGALIADQAEAHGQIHENGRLGRAYIGLPDDLLNFHHDPLACAVAWAGPEPRWKSCGCFRFETRSCCACNPIRTDARECAGRLRRSELQ